jgi:hypothetical protein
LRVDVAGSQKGIDATLVSASESLGRVDQGPPGGSSQLEFLPGVADHAVLILSNDGTDSDAHVKGVSISCEVIAS